MALVDYIEPSEARNAFKGLAYRRYQHTPLYLEWAPLGVIGTKAAKHYLMKIKNKSKSRTLTEKLEGSSEEKDEECSNTL